MQHIVKCAIYKEKKMIQSVILKTYQLEKVNLYIKIHLSLIFA